MTALNTPGGFDRRPIQPINNAALPSVSHIGVRPLRLAIELTA